MTETPKLRAGDHHYKAYIGPPDRYDFMGATQFRLLASLGLRADHTLLDFGCGSLRAGKLYIPYLDAGNYYGQDPNQWLIDDGIANELGQDIIQIKKPNFSNRDDFEIGFDARFDFAVAQSIFSHTNLDLMEKGICSIVRSLAPDGIALVTVIEGDDYTGDEAWVYPDCTTFERKTIASVLNRSGALWRRLWWFHPAQTWYLLTPAPSRLPNWWQTFTLLGGEEVGSRQYKDQSFFRNRLFSFKKGRST